MVIHEAYGKMEARKEFSRSSLEQSLQMAGAVQGVLLDLLSGNLIIEIRQIPSEVYRKWSSQVCCDLKWL